MEEKAMETSSDWAKTTGGWNPAADDPAGITASTALGGRPQSGTRNLASPDDWGREVELAELEMRLRKFSLELIQPTIQKTTGLDGITQDLEERIEECHAKVDEMRGLAVKTERANASVVAQRELMSRWDGERHDFQIKVQESISNMNQDLDVFRYQLERQDSSMSSVQRTADRVVGELVRVQEGSQVLGTHVEQRVRETTSMLNGTKADLEVKFVDLESRHNRLSDELWDESTGLARLQQEIRTLSAGLKSQQDELTGMRHDKASVRQLEAVQHEVNGLQREAYGSIETLQKSVENALSDVKAHFGTATNTVAAHSAAMLQEVRASYQDELNQSAAMRTEILAFMAESKENVSRMEEVLESSALRTEETLKKVSGEVQDLAKRKGRAGGNGDADVQGMREALGNVHASSEQVARSLEHLSSVVWMVVQSERAASALDMQDDSDRGKVALMGYKDGGNVSRRPSVNRRPSAGSMGAAASGRFTSSPGPGDPETVISVDNRCLSCSGQAQTVLSGFKMACLEYAPGPVHFAKKVYERTDLLGLREKLLDQAYQALQHGPISFARTEVFGQKEQPRQLSFGSRPVTPTAPSQHRSAEAYALDDRPESRMSGISVGSSSAGAKMPPLSARGPGVRVK